MVGPPGAGKSMLAARLPGILRPLSPAEAIEVAMVRSVAGALGDGTIDPARPFRDPHHSSSMPALWSPPLPGSPPSPGSPPLLLLDLVNGGDEPFALPGRAWLD